jgi:chromosomal replication initiator protein
MMDHILRLAAERFDVSVSDIKSQRRSRQVLPARHIAAYLAHTASGISPHEIGEGLGGRDYTNIVMYCRTVARRTQEDAEFRRLVDELVERVESRTELP